MSDLRSSVAASLAQAPIIGVVRTHSSGEARAIAEQYIDGGLQMIEITFTVPEATELVRSLQAMRGEGPPWIGMGTVTTPERVDRALAAGAEFIVSPNTDAGIAARVQAAERYLILGALTCSEIVAANALGADLVKVYPLAPVGGPAYLEVVRQPLGDIPMLAAGGFEVEEIPAYRDAGAVAFGIGAPLLDGDADSVRARIARALALARGEEIS
jgi:2-dehydro-3-deoxyphosphogluconate aldolase/(4S)-4-hydroxy-2-oxoglutarate aldolase